MKNIASRRLSAVFGMLLVAGLATGLAACNTVRGAGQDVSAVGHGVSHGATSTQNSIDRATK